MATNTLARSRTRKNNLNDIEKKILTGLISRHFGVTEVLAKSTRRAINSGEEFIVGDKSRQYGYLFFNNLRSPNYEKNMQRTLREYEDDNNKPIHYIFIDRQNKLAGFHWRKR
ncbi:hypothetical protein KW787_00780 [Candidatus Pacearchaeota archaeon]|nr:hypothetical protein [Candidatus Pacearchaeota archaeon]